MTTLHKTVRIGLGPDGNVFCKITFNSTALSITGVEGPIFGGNARGSAGQIIMQNWQIKEYAPGWNAGREAKFREIWNEWHLNDMQAGSPDQRAYLKANPVTFTYPESHYEKASAALREVGLNPDPNFLHKGSPYAYGHAWLFQKVPEDVIAFLASLPETDMTPAWV